MIGEGRRAAARVSKCKRLEGVVKLRLRPRAQDGRNGRSAHARAAQREAARHDAARRGPARLGSARLGSARRGSARLVNRCSAKHPARTLAVPAVDDRYVS